MISIEQINGEIAVLEDEKPTHIIMQKLAALYTVRDHIVIQEQPAVAPVMSEPRIGTLGMSEFLTAVSGKETDKIIMLMDDLMNTLAVVNPKLYSSVLQKIKDS